MARRGWFYRLRVGVLLTTLAVVSLWACYDVRDRRARNEWHDPVRVGLVILQRGKVDQAAMGALHARTSVLEQRLASEFQRYRPAHAPMIQLIPYGPVHVDELPPTDPGMTYWERLRHAYDLWRYTRAVDKAAGVPTLALDSRIYVVVDPPRAGMVEGFSESSGRVGVARVQLDRDTVDLALFVAAHELLHTLGATDKYDDFGRTQIPAGLAEPELVPLYPQRHAEIMARNRVVGPNEETPPRDLSELYVGRITAEEIGWAR